MSSFMTSSPVVLPSEISKVNDAAEPALLNDKILQPSAQELVTMSATVCDATWSEENEKVCGKYSCLLS